MIKPTLLGATLLLLGACAPFETYYKTGASVAKLQTDTTNCEVKALRDAPVANQVRQSAPYYIPGRTYCDGNGRCHRNTGYWVPGRVYTVDVNAPLRLKVLDQCMARKGYQRTEIPVCSTSVARSVPAAITRTLPTLTPNSCVIRNEGGSWQIVTVGDSQLAGQTE
ncbi:MAG: hypothetical protein ABJI96_04095 [Paracoccaceae bacterium]